MEMGDGEKEHPLLIPPLPECVQGCPGCAIRLRKLSTSATPVKEFLFVAVLALCNTLPISSLFPFIYFMTEDFNIAESETQIAFYAGFIGSAYMLGRGAGSTPWGLLADKYGRKPVIIFGTAAVVVFNTMFGFSTTYWMALLSRFLLGFFNGLLGTIRAYVSEIASEEQQALGMSLVGTMWGLGLVIGPAIGGYLARPSISYPGIFPTGSLFDEFPYALPCLCISAFAAMALVMSIWIPETLHNHPILSRIETTSDNKKEEETAGDKSHYIRLLSKPVSMKKSLWRNWGLVASISVYCIWSIHDMGYSEIFSLWAVSPLTLGGLGMSTSNVGIILAISGFALLVFQLLIYPSVQHILGAILTCQVSAILSVPLVLLYPLISRLDGIWLWIMITSASSLKNVLSTAVMTACFILINNSVTADQRGVANGVSMAIVSLFKAIGPAIAGVLLSWAETRMNASFLPGTWMVFCILALLCCFTIGFTLDPVLPKSLDRPNPAELLE